MGCNVSAFFFFFFFPQKIVAMGLFDLKMFIDRFNSKCGLCCLWLYVDRLHTRDTRVCGGSETGHIFIQVGA